VFFHRDVEFSFRVISSHSCWTNSSRSRQKDPDRQLGPILALGIVDVDLSGI